MRETRACLICITHWTFEIVDDMTYLDVQQIIDTYITMKVGKKRHARPELPDSPNAGETPRSPRSPLPSLEHFNSPQEEQAAMQANAQENVKAMRERKHISTQPLWVQRAFALRNTPMDQVFDELKQKK